MRKFKSRGWNPANYRFQPISRYYKKFKGRLRKTPPDEDDVLSFPEGLFFPSVNPKHWHGDSLYIKPYGRKKWALGRQTMEQRDAVLRQLVTQVLKNGEIVTYYPRAKLASYFVERAIELAKAGGAENLQKLKDFIYGDELAENVFEEAPKRFANIDSGFVTVKKVQKLKITKHKHVAQMARIEFVAQ